MEHLPLVDHPNPVRVKHRAHSTYGFDQKGFLGFPKRKGVDQQALVDHSRHDLDDNCFRVFKQAWLFWGLLSEFMLPAGKVDFEHFLEDDKLLGRRITTKRLMGSLARWRSSLDKRVNPTYFMRLNLVLTTAKAVARSLSASALAGSNPVLPPDHEDSIAVAILGETLQWALIEAQKSRTSSIPGWSLDDGRGWGLSMYDPNDLARHGICPFDFVFLKGLLKGSVCGFYYANSLKSFATSKSSISHQFCNIQHCTADEIIEQYRPRHVTHSCSCSFLEPDQHAIANTVLTRSIPVLDYVDEPPSLTVKRHQHGLPYVVVSHVWVRIELLCCLSCADLIEGRWTRQPRGQRNVSLPNEEVDQTSQEIL